MYSCIKEKQGALIRSMLAQQTFSALSEENLDAPQGLRGNSQGIHGCIVKIQCLQVAHAFFYPGSIDFRNPIDGHTPRAPLPLPWYQPRLIFMVEYYEKINRLILDFY